LQHFWGLEWFHDVALRASLDRKFYHLLLAYRRAHDHFRVRVDGLDPFQGLDPVHLRHYDVHCHQVRLELLVLGNGLVAVTRLSYDVMAAGKEDILEKGTHEEGVVHYENSPHIYHYTGKCKEFK